MLKKQAERECLLAKEAEGKKLCEAKEKQKAIELKIQQKLNKETEEREAKMTEARIKISMHKRKNMDIRPELIKIAKLDEKPKAINTKADTMHLGLQQPNPNSLHAIHQTFLNLFSPVDNFRES